MLIENQWVTNVYILSCDILFYTELVQKHAMQDNKDLKNMHYYYS